MLDREAVIRALEYLISEDCTENQFDYVDEIGTAIALLKEQNNCENCAIAIEDRQPVVRCKDCKYGEQCIPPCEDRYCIFYDERHDGNWFCADGKRNDNDD